MLAVLFSPSHWESQLEHVAERGCSREKKTLLETSMEFQEVGFLDLPVDPDLQVWDSYFISSRAVVLHKSRGKQSQFVKIMTWSYIQWQP